MRRLLALSALVAPALVWLACDDGAPASSPGDADASVVVLPDAGGTPDVGAPSGGTATLGATCAADAECRSGLLCLHDDGSVATWPAHGVCTAACDDDATCAALAPGALCAAGFGGTQKYCVEACTQHAPPYTSLSAGMPAGKCHGRNDMACAKLAAGTGCAPVCNDDSACPNGACDPASGRCIRGASHGWEDIGRVDGACGTGVTTGPGGFCTATCTVGVVPSCTWSGPGKPARAACFRGPTSPGQGDVGSCVKLCDCNDDCSAPLTCLPTSASVQQSTGRKGTCGTGANGIACGDAGSDAGPDGG